MAGGRGRATASTAVAEHRVQMPAAAGAGKLPATAAPPERLLVGFLHFLALVERAGNALGTLAFTWATVVLLGGYPTVLSNGGLVLGDFEAATIVFFLEATRMFSNRSNRLDYQLFFSTRGAFRPLAWNGLVVIVCFSDVLMCILIWNMHWSAVQLWFLFILTLCTCHLLSPRLHVHNPLRRALSLWSPMVAILLLGLSVPYSCDDCNNYSVIHTFTVRTSVTKWTVYLVLFVVVLLVTISRMQLPNIIKLADSGIGRKLVFWRKTVINLCMVAAALMLAVTSGGLMSVFISCQAYGLVIVSFGNLQVPAALLRVGLAALCLSQLGDYGEHGDKTNLVPSLTIFYVMVLGQGILYIVPCILQVFSFIFRRSLVRRAGFRGEWGVECVDFYYSYTFEKHMEGGILSAKNISIVAFAIESLKSDTPKMQLHGVRMLHSFLEKEPFKSMTISKLTNSTKTVTLLLNMLGWTSEDQRDIRVLAAKVLAELALSLRVFPIPGAIRLIASLLNTIHQPEIKNHILENCRKDEKQEAPIQEEHPSPILTFWKQMTIYCLIPVEDPSKLRDEQDTYILKCWKHITKCCSVREEDQPVDHDLLPVLGMLILERLANYDIENCMEIIRAPGLISMIIEFASNRTDLTDIDETHQALLASSSLKVLRRLTSTEGRFGVKLRHEISEHPFLLSNLARILDGNGSSQELGALTAAILRNLAMDENSREQIGHFGVIISMLMHIFLRQDTPLVTDSEQLLKIVAGQALAVLAIESPNNCLAMSEEAGYMFIKELATMINVDRYKYIAASLLRNMCAHARSKFSKADLTELSLILPKVLEGIMGADGGELEVLAGLSSQICIVIPGDFAQELEHGWTKETFIRRLVNSLNANMNPAAHCPGVRRAILEQAVCMMEQNSSYTKCFIKCRMMEALMMVERKHSRAENYRYFLGEVGLMEHSVSFSALVARAKELMSGNDLYWD